MSENTCRSRAAPCQWRWQLRTPRGRTARIRTGSSKKYPVIIAADTGAYVASREHRLGGRHISSWRGEVTGCPSQREDDLQLWWSCSAAPENTIADSVHFVCSEVTEVARNWHLKDLQLWWSCPAALLDRMARERIRRIETREWLPATALPIELPPGFPPGAGLEPATCPLPEEVTIMPSQLANRS